MWGLDFSDACSRLLQRVGTASCCHTQQLRCQDFIQGRRQLGLALNTSSLAKTRGHYYRLRLPYTVRQATSSNDRRLPQISGNSDDTTKAGRRPANVSST